jgi:hypothetical protein
MLTDVLPSRAFGKSMPVSGRGVEGNSVELNAPRVAVLCSHMRGRIGVEVQRGMVPEVGQPVSNSVSDSLQACSRRA